MQVRFLEREKMLERLEREQTNTSNEKINADLMRSEKQYGKQTLQHVRINDK